MESIAIIGASSNREKFSNKCVRAYLSKGYKVFPVNPNEESVEGIKCFDYITEINEEIDIVSIYVKNEILEKLTEGIIAKKPGLVYFNPGTENKEALWKFRNSGIRVLEECSILAIGIMPSSL